MSAMNKGNYTFKTSCVVTSPVATLVLHLDLVLVTIQDRFASLDRDLFPRCI